MRNNKDTIAAITSPAGEGAIAIVRLSGSDSIAIADQLFYSKKLDSLTKALTYHQYFGEIKSEGIVIDEVLLTVYRSPHSYTGEDAVEISCHGSLYIQEKILHLLIEQGAKPAKGGEFTMRAFMNNKMDLSQAEAVADLIASQSASSHRIAIEQMRGGFAHKITELREQMLNFVSLMELELDFSEEDVEFADRKQFFALIEDLKQEIQGLINSFRLGNVIKNGIPVAIVGEPNVGKSTLLNTLLDEEKAIVSDIPGTTRDTIEDTLNIEGYLFRFMDTAGLRESSDKIERLGVERTYSKLNQALIVLAVFDSATENVEDFKMRNATLFMEEKYRSEGKKILYIGNKIDLSNQPKENQQNILYISAKERTSIVELKNQLVQFVKTQQDQSQVLVSNIRHFEALQKALESLLQAEEGFQMEMPTDLISVDVRTAIYALGSIVGDISTPEILGTIFGKFCIGK